MGYMNQFVIVKPEILHAEFQNISKRVFFVYGGSGNIAFTHGSKIKGFWVYDGTSETLQKEWIERIATSEEIAQARSLSVSQ